MPYIYKLTDPNTSEVRYIGKTGSSLNRRLQQHIYRSAELRNHKDYWIQSLLKKGQSPEITLVEEATDSDWESREIFWIGEYRKTGKLTNVADGGGNNRPKSGEHNHKAVYSREDVREVVTLFTLGFSRDIIRSFDKYKSLSDKTIRTWCSRECRIEDTAGIPTRREYQRSL